MLKIGVAGLRRGAVYLEKASALKFASVTAICDTDRERADTLANKYGIETVFYDYEDLLKSDVDAIVVATPITDHKEHVTAALRAGKHVLSEVICATTVEDCEALYKAVKSSDKKYMMAENYCYIRPVTIVKNMVNDGKLGDIYYAESVYLKDFAEYHPDFPDIGGWRQPTYFGRKGHPYITHSIGPLLDIMKDKVVSVTAMGAGNMYDMVADNTCALLCRTKKGRLIYLRSSFVSPRPDNFIYYSFQGTKGCYQGPQGDTDYHKVHFRKELGPNEWKNVYAYPEYYPDYIPEAYRITLPWDNDPYAMYDSGFEHMYQDFVDCIVNDTEPPIGIDDAMNWTLTGILSGESVERFGKTVEIPDYSKLC